MTVGDLRRALEGLPDSTPVLRPTYDHSYVEARGYKSSALFARGAREWTEDFGEELTPEATHGQRQDVFVVE